jgi:NitT/TauT family transport system ATP-binding protein
VDAVVDVQEVSFGYSMGNDERKLLVLQGMTFSVSRGESVCILGPSGCGKSTLIQLIAGLLCPSAGKIAIDVSWHSNGAVVPCTILFQELNLFYWYTAARNVELPLAARGLPRAARKTEVARLLEKVGLGQFARYYPHELSGGMRQRLAIARSLATRAPILLLDEPFGQLDPGTRASVESDLLALWKREGLTLITVTHDIQQAIRLSDRVIVMTARPGTISAVETVKLARPRDKALATEEFHRIEDRLWQQLNA